MHPIDAFGHQAALLGIATGLVYAGAHAARAARRARRARRQYRAHLAACWAQVDDAKRAR